MSSSSQSEAEEAICASVSQLIESSSIEPSLVSENQKISFSSNSPVNQDISDSVCEPPKKSSPSAFSTLRTGEENLDGLCSPQSYNATSVSSSPSSSISTSVSSISTLSSTTLLSAGSSTPGSTPNSVPDSTPNSCGPIDESCVIGTAVINSSSGSVLAEGCPDYIPTIDKTELAADANCKNVGKGIADSKIDSVSEQVDLPITSPCVTHYDMSNILKKDRADVFSDCKKTFDSTSIIGAVSYDHVIDHLPILEESQNRNVLESKQYSSPLQSQEFSFPNIADGTTLIPSNSLDNTFSKLSTDLASSSNIIPVEISTCTKPPLEVADSQVIDNKRNKETEGTKISRGDGDAEYSKSPILSNVKSPKHQLVDGGSSPIADGYGGYLCFEKWQQQPAISLYNNNSNNNNNIENGGSTTNRSSPFPQTVNGSLLSPTAASKVPSQQLSAGDGIINTSTAVNCTNIVITTTSSNTCYNSEPNTTPGNCGFFPRDSFNNPTPPYPTPPYPTPPYGTMTTTANNIAGSYPNGANVYSTSCSGNYTGAASYPTPSTPSSGYTNPNTPNSSYPNPTTPSSSYGNPTTPNSNYHNPTTPCSNYPNPTTPNYPNPTTPSSSYPNPTTPSSSYPNPTTPSSSYPNPTTPSSSCPNPTTPSSSYPNSTTPSSSYPNPTTPSSSYPNTTTPSSSYANPTTPGCANPTTATNLNPSTTNPKYYNPSTPTSIQVSKSGGPSNLPAGNNSTLPSKCYSSVNSPTRTCSGQSPPVTSGANTTSSSIPSSYLQSQYANPNTPGSNSSNPSPPNSNYAYPNTPGSNYGNSHTPNSNYSNPSTPGLNYCNINTPNTNYPNTENSKSNVESTSQGGLPYTSQTSNKSYNSENFASSNKITGSIFSHGIPSTYENSNNNNLNVISAKSSEENKLIYGNKSHFINENSSGHSKNCDFSSSCSEVSSGYGITNNYGSSSTNDQSTFPNYNSRASNSGSMASEELLNSLAGAYEQQFTSSGDKCNFDKLKMLSADKQALSAKEAAFQSGSNNYIDFVEQYMNEKYMRGPSGNQALDALTNMTNTQHGLDLSNVIPPFLPNNLPSNIPPGFMPPNLPGSSMGMSAMSDSLGMGTIPGMSSGTGLTDHFLHHERLMNHPGTSHMMSGILDNMPSHMKFDNLPPHMKGGGSLSSSGNGNGGYGDLGHHHTSNHFMSMAAAAAMKEAMDTIPSHMSMSNMLADNMMHSINHSSGLHASGSPDAMNLDIGSSGYNSSWRTPTLNSSNSSQQHPRTGGKAGNINGNRNTPVSSTFGGLSNVYSSKMSDGSQTSGLNTYSSNSVCNSSSSNSRNLGSSVSSYLPHQASDNINSVSSMPAKIGHASASRMQPSVSNKNNNPSGDWSHHGHHHHQLGAQYNRQQQYHHMSSDSYSKEEQMMSGSNNYGSSTSSHSYNSTLTSSSPSANVPSDSIYTHITPDTYYNQNIVYLPDGTSINVENRRLNCPCILCNHHRENITKMGGINNVGNHTSCVGRGRAGWFTKTSKYKLNLKVNTSFGMAQGLNSSHSPIGSLSRASIAESISSTISSVISNAVASSSSSVISQCDRFSSTSTLAHTEKNVGVKDYNPSKFSEDTVSSNCIPSNSISSYTHNPYVSDNRNTTITRQSAEGDMFLYANRESSNYNRNYQSSHTDNHNPLSHYKNNTSMLVSKSEQFSNYSPHDQSRMFPSNQSRNLDSAIAHFKQENSPKQTFIPEGLKPVVPNIRVKNFTEDLLCNSLNCTSSSGINTSDVVSNSRHASVVDCSQVPISDNNATSVLPKLSLDPSHLPSNQLSSATQPLLLASVPATVHSEDQNCISNNYVPKPVNICLTPPVTSVEVTSNVKTECGAVSNNSTEVTFSDSSKKQSTEHFPVEDANCAKHDVIDSINANNEPPTVNTTNTVKSLGKSISMTKLSAEHKTENLSTASNSPKRCRPNEEVADELYSFNDSSVESPQNSPVAHKPKKRKLKDVPVYKSELSTDPESTGIKLKIKLTTPRSSVGKSPSYSYTAYSSHHSTSSASGFTSSPSCSSETSAFNSPSHTMSYTYPSTSYDNKPNRRKSLDKSDSGGSKKKKLAGSSDYSSISDLALLNCLPGNPININPTVVLNSIPDTAIVTKKRRKVKYSAHESDITGHDVGLELHSAVAKFTKNIPAEAVVKGEPQSPWSCRLSPEILLKIFQFAMNGENCVPMLLR